MDVSIAITLQWQIFFFFFFFLKIFKKKKKKKKICHCKVIAIETSIVFNML